MSLESHGVEEFLDLLTDMKSCKSPANGPETSVPGFALFCVNGPCPSCPVPILMCSAIPNCAVPYRGHEPRSLKPLSILTPFLRSKTAMDLQILRFFVRLPIQTHILTCHL